ncbi:DUF1127 domain-containing protein [Jiella mangrovi]|uniref:DUF1127 domain-containing protein n=1 Tax=Jiella mangrovi TaxID=2821407 RepID=A0ABS4BK16_9HYPH|nr:DUF1127 domain-containing protein [Jiella mangrovi]MBP0617096.1 DUF1127 domain-containing protein [Jiella mangrovi]
MTMHHARIAQIEDQSVTGFSRLRTKAEALPTLSEAFRSLVAATAFLLRAFDRRRQMRQDILSLTEEQLHDVGLTRDEAVRAAERVEWRGDWK